MEYFYIEVTDVYGGEDNYSWATRHIIKAKTMRGAVNRFSRMSGISWRCVGGHDGQRRYDSRSGATCFFIEPFSEENTEGFRFSTDERSAA